MSMNDTIFKIVENTIKTKRFDPDTLQDNLGAFIRQYHDQVSSVFEPQTAYDFKSTLTRAVIYSAWSKQFTTKQERLSLSSLLQVLQKLSYFHPHQRLNEDEIQQYADLLSLFNEARQCFDSADFFTTSTLKPTSLSISATFTRDTLKALFDEFAGNDVVFELNCYQHVVGCLRLSEGYMLYLPQAGLVLCDGFSALWDVVLDEFSSQLMTMTAKTKAYLAKRFDSKGISLSIKGCVLQQEGCQAMMLSSDELLAKYHVAADYEDDGSDCPPLVLAAFTGCTASFEYFINVGGETAAKRSFNGDDPLFLACLNGNERQVQLWIDAFGSDSQVYTTFNDKGESPMTIACERGHKAIVQRLIDAGADINARHIDKMSCFHKLCANGETAIAQLFIDAGIEIDGANKEGMTALYIASQHGHASTVTALLRAGASIDEARDNGMTPLYVACQNAHEEVTAVLLTASPSLNKAKDDGMTPLFIACQNGRHAVAKLVAEALSKDAEALDITIAGGISPFFIACQNGHLAIVKLLLSLQSAQELIQQRTDTGENAFFAAVRAGRVPVVKYLLKNLGTELCGLDAPRNDGLTPFSMAMFKKNKSMLVTMVRTKMDDGQEAYDVLKAYEALVVGYYLGGEFEAADELIRRYRSMVDLAKASGMSLADVNQASQWQQFLSQFGLDEYVEQLTAKGSLLKKIKAAVTTA